MMIQLQPPILSIAEAKAAAEKAQASKLLISFEFGKTLEKHTKFILRKLSNNKNCEIMKLFAVVREKIPIPLPFWVVALALNGENNLALHWRVKPSQIPQPPSVKFTCDVSRRIWLAEPICIYLYISIYDMISDASGLFRTFPSSKCLTQSTRKLHM